MDLKPVSDPAAWRAADFPSPEAYTLPMTAADIAEIDAAIDGYRARGLAFAATGRDDFAFPTLSVKLARAYAEVRDGRGFVLIRGLPAGERGVEWMRGAVWGIGTHFGDAVNQTAGGSMLADVMDMSRSDTSPRGYNTARELGLHTDPASDLIGLACVRQASQGGETALGSAATLHNQMLALRPDLARVMYEGFYCHRFGEGRPEDGEVTAAPVPVFAVRDGKFCFRGVRQGMVAAYRELGIEMSPAQVEAWELWNALARRPENRLTFRMGPGDLVITNNLVVMHARTEFSDGEDRSEPRHMLRLWLAGRDFRPVPREMNYFNGGDCGIPLTGAVSHYRDMAGLRADLAAQGAGRA